MLIGLFCVVHEIHCRSLRLLFLILWFDYSANNGDFDYTVLDRNALISVL